MPSFQFHFDRLSFWLGFLAATLFWWLVNRIRPLLPLWQASFRQYLTMLSQRNFSSVEDYLRREALQNAQRQHLAAPLFSLDEILIAPRLMTPPLQQEPGAPPMHQSMAGQVLPYLPDWPELVAPFGIPEISPAQAIHSGRHLAFIGQPGSGKTVALAHLASQLARRDLEVEKFAQTLPLYLHIFDLDLPVQEEGDPLDNLAKAVVGGASMMMQPQIPRFLRAVFKDKQRRIILLLDGLDELPAERLVQAVDYLKLLLKTCPRMQLVTTASSDYLDGLTKLGVYPLAVAAWSSMQRKELARKWGALWNEYLLTDVKKQATVTEIDQVFMNSWLDAETEYASPLEWTIRVWGAYAGDVSGNSALNILDAHLTRYLPGPQFIPALEQLGHWMAKNTQPSLSFDEMEKFLSALKLEKAVALPLENNNPNQAVSTDSETPPQDDSQEKKPRKKQRHKVGIATQGEEIITALLDGGILIEQANHQLRFANPVLLGYLAGMNISDEEASVMVNLPTWSVHQVTLQYAVACSEQPDWIYPLLEDPTPPLFRNLLLAARWLRDAPFNAEWRSYMMRLLVTQIQNETLPLGVRARLIAAFTLSGDPSVPKLFKQLLTSKTAEIRQAALLGCGALGSSQLIREILASLTDPQPEVRYTACMALAAINSEAAIHAVVEALLSGDEEIRQAAAESLALNQANGHKVLQEAAELEDLLTRRAAVFGLQQVREPWSRKILEKLAIEDGQWVVRNAAAQALDTLQQTAPPIPKVLTRPSDTGWILTFASKLGMGIIPGKPATDVLLAVLKSGTVEEQTAALYYLRDQADEVVVETIYNLYTSGQKELAEPVLHALWWMAVSGVQLPVQPQYSMA